jgi:hypothetical protein
MAMFNTACIGSLKTHSPPGGSVSGVNGSRLSRNTKDHPVHRVMHPVVVEAIRRRDGGQVFSFDSRLPALLSWRNAGAIPSYLLWLTLIYLGPSCIESACDGFPCRQH